MRVSDISGGGRTPRTTPLDPSLTGIEVEYLNVCHIVECYWHCASISRYYGSMSIFLRVDYRHKLITTTVAPLLKEYQAIKKCKVYCKLKFLLTRSQFSFCKLIDNPSIVVKECKNSIFTKLIRKSNSDSQQFLIIQKQTSALIKLK